MPDSGANEKLPGIFYDKGGAVINAEHPDFGVVFDGVTSVDSSMAACIAAAVLLGGATIQLPRGNGLITTPLPLANLGHVPITIQGHGAGVDTYNTTPTVGSNFYGRTGTQAVIETQGSHHVRLRDFGVYSLLGDSDRSAVGIFIGRTTFQASAQYHNYERVFVTLANKTGANAGRGSIAFMNVNGEHGVFDHCQFVADLPLASNDTNALSYTPTIGTQSIVTSCTLNQYRECAFTALSYAAMELRGLQSTTFADCYYGAFVELPVAVQIIAGGNVPAQIRFKGGQVETFDSFLQIGVLACHDIEVDLTWASTTSSGPLILCNVNNNQIARGLRVRIWNTNAVVMDLIGVGAAAGCKLVGGHLVLENGIKLSAPTLKLLGTTVEDTQDTPATISLIAGSKYLLLTSAGGSFV